MSKKLHPKIEEALTDKTPLFAIAVVGDTKPEQSYIAGWGVKPTPIKKDPFKKVLSIHYGYLSGEYNRHNFPPMLFGDKFAADHFARTFSVITKYTITVEVVDVKNIKGINHG